MRLTLNSPLFQGVLLVEFAGFVAAILWLAVAHARFVRCLRTQHPDVWSEIQQPPLASPADPAEKRSLRRRARVTDYLYRRGFRSLEDPVIRRLGEQAWRASLLFHRVHRRRRGPDAGPRRVRRVMRPGAPAARTLRRALQVLLVAALLAIILNPELRALVLLTNALGLEITLILIALQARALLLATTPGLDRPAVLLCRLASRLGYLALRAYPSAASLQLFSRLLCPALITVSYGLNCRASRIRANHPG